MLAHVYKSLTLLNNICFGEMCKIYLDYNEIYDPELIVVLTKINKKAKLTKLLQT